MGEQGCVWSMKGEPGCVGGGRVNERANQGRVSLKRGTSGQKSIDGYGKGWIRTVIVRLERGVNNAGFRTWARNRWLMWKGQIWTGVREQAH